jgi:UDP-N-acetylglucosamine 2-epimerase (non-hydrolysing)
MSSSPVALIAGARPNFMKVKPVLDALEAVGIATDLVHTGQHYDALMSDVFFHELGIRTPDHHLGVGSGSHASQTAAVMTGFEQYVEQRRPSAVLVFGDVNSTVACALVAAKAGAMVGHVEAGLRSRDWGMPEEINRVVTDRLSDLLMAPSEDGVENLRAEGYRPDQIRLIGNVMIDTLRSNLDRARERQIAARLGVADGYAVVTLHRPSNVDDPAGLARLVTALGRVAESCPVVFPTHPRTRAKLEGIAIPAGVQLIDPLGYLDFLDLQAGARVVITDSGGIQEETTALGVACITARVSTERPITVSEGTNRVVGTDPDVVVAAALEAIDAPPPARCPALWDGKAGERAAVAVAEMLEAGPTRWPRPTALA